MEKLSGKTALVTGSTDGVGRLVARKLGQAGARVLVHGREAERGARVVADVEASGGAADFLAADLSALAEARRLAEAIPKKSRPSGVRQPSRSSLLHDLALIAAVCVIQLTRNACQLSV